MIRFTLLKPVSGLLTIALAALTACGGGESNDRKDGFTPTGSKDDSLFHEVMEGHDAAMARMGKLSGAIKKTQENLDSLGKAPKESKDLIVLYTALSGELKSAEKNMNDWMEQFSVDSARDNEAVRLAYLESEKLRVNKVKEAILVSLAKADSLLTK